MHTATIIVVITLLLAASLYAAWLDHKHNWRLLDWMGGQCSNPFTQAHQSESRQSQREQPLKQKDAQIQALTERVEILEKIVTEPAYELNAKINALK